MATVFLILTDIAALTASEKEALKSRLVSPFIKNSDYQPFIVTEPSNNSYSYPHKIS